MVGTWTSVVGCHQTWKFWAMQSKYLLDIGPQYAYGQALLADLFPGLVGIVSNGPLWIGPVACSAIVDASSYQWMAFTLAVALILVPTVAIVFTSEVKTKAETATYLLKETWEMNKVTTAVAEGSLGPHPKTGLRGRTSAGVLGGSLALRQGV